MGKRLKLAAVAGMLALVLEAPLGAQQFEKKLSLAQTGIGYGARALALGGAFIAVADDITAMSYNPAGLAQLLKPEVSFGLSGTSQSYFLPEADQTGSGWETYLDTPANIRYSYVRFEYLGGVLPLKIAGLPVVLGIGLQTKTNERSKPEYDHISESGGDEYRVRQVRRISGNDFGAMNVATLSLAARPVEFLHVGFNVNYWREIGEKNNSYGSHESAFYAGSLWWDGHIREFEHEDLRITKGFNADLGILLKFKNVSAGLVYKTAFGLDYRAVYTGDYRLLQVGDGTLSDHEEWEAAGRLRWPHSLGAGISVRPFEILTLSADYTFSNWSEGEIVWETPPPDVISPQGYPVEAPRDIRQYRVGAEFLPFVGNKLAVAARAGWFADQAYWADIDGLPIDFHGLCFGIGLIAARTSIDIAAVHYAGSYKAWQYYIEDERQANWHVLASFSFKIGK
jgi:long-chain fatty acid transport protein